MATKTGNRGPARQSNLPGSRLVRDPLPGRVLVTPGDGPKDQMGFLIALICMVLVFCLMLPIITVIYFDTLAVQKESKAQIDRMERLRKQLEEDRKKMDQANRKED
jgi:uncharacterized membrane protein (DUF106 family)